MLHAIKSIFLLGTLAYALPTPDKSTDSTGAAAAYTWCDGPNFTGKCTTLASYSADFKTCRALPSHLSLSYTAGVVCRFYWESKTCKGKDGGPLPEPGPFIGWGGTFLQDLGLKYWICDSGKNA